MDYIIGIILYLNVTMYFCILSEFFAFMPWGLPIPNERYQSIKQSIFASSLPKRFLLRFLCSFPVASSSCLPLTPSIAAFQFQFSSLRVEDSKSISRWLWASDVLVLGGIIFVWHFKRLSWRSSFPSMVTSLEATSSTFSQIKVSIAPRVFNLPILCRW